MSEPVPVFIEWEEQIICPEKGSRVIHFYLKDASGNSVLAVVGKERSVRHMMYFVSDEFLRAYGSKESFSASKWRARREVVDWLTCLVSRNRPQSIGVQMTNSTQAVESFEMLSAAVCASKKYLPDQMVSRKLKCQSSDIEWSGITWFCAKQLKHYSGFCRNGTTIYVHSFIYIMAEEESHYLGYLEDMYEDKKGHKKVKVRWFYRSQEVKNMIPQLIFRPGEVFITNHVQVISAECVNGPAIVLTPKHYEKCLAAFLLTSSEVHMCCRQFKNNKLKPFALAKLRGYCDQSVPSGLISPILSKRKVKCHKSHREDDENFTQDDSLRPNSKRNRSAKGYQVFEKGFSGMQNAAPGNQLTKCEPTYPKSKVKLSRETMGVKTIGPKLQCHFSFKADDKIELLCQDSGIRGCWFRCKILSTSQRQLKIQYEDVLDVDGLGKLEEWVNASRVAASDKLGMRCSGRVTVRPCPPQNYTDPAFEIGQPVDAWWSDGWWEGVVTGVNSQEVGTFQIFLPDEEKFLMFEKKNIRISRDWVGNRWVDIPWKPDICSYISSNGGSSIKLTANPAMVDKSVSNDSVVLGNNFPLTCKAGAMQKDEPEPSNLDASDDLKGVTFRKPLLVVDENKENISAIGNIDDTDRDNVNNNTDKNNQGKLMVEENFDSTQLKLDAETVAVA